jgi:hypothetical protein
MFLNVSRRDITTMVAAERTQAYSTHLKHVDVRIIYLTTLIARVCENRNTYTILEGNLQRKRPLEK